VNRRELIAFLASTAAVSCPVNVGAQQSAPTARMGFLRFGPASANATRVEALRVGLRQLGYEEGRNIAIEFRWADTVEQLPALAADLVHMNVDVIFAMSSTEVEAARQATKTIPIVFGVNADPVGLGHVESLAHPGGNITGLTIINTDLVAKQLEVLKELLPQASRIGVLFGPTAPSHRPALEALQTASQKLGVHLFLLPARTGDDFEGAFSTMAREGVGSFLAVAAPVFVNNRARLAELALKHRMPAAYGDKANVEAGGLISYGADFNYLVQRAATYIDKILNGAKPADLPVEQASKYEVVINLKTAKALGLTVPPTLLARADEVIE
jgi:putative ABC transport system substrate-binding protein